MRKALLLMMVVAILSVLSSCIPLGKVGQVFAPPTGPDEPVGGLSKYLEPDTLANLVPASVVIPFDKDEYNITVNVTAPFVFKEVYLCGTPCSSVDNWTKIGEYSNGPRTGNYYRPSSLGLAKNFTINRSQLSSGNNFIAVNMCSGLGDCGNVRKWARLKFTVTFRAECESDAECAANPVNKKCDTTAKKCVSCLQDTDCTGGGKKCVGSGGQQTCVTKCMADTQCAFRTVNNACQCANTNDATQTCQGPTDTACVCDETCKQSGTTVNSCANKLDGTKCGDVRVCKNEQCVLSECYGKDNGVVCSTGTCLNGLCTRFINNPTSLDAPSAQLMASPASGTTTLVVDTTSNFNAGDEVIIHQTVVEPTRPVTEAGLYEFNKIASVTTGTAFTLQKPLLRGYAVGQTARAQIVKVARSEQFVVSSSLTASEWNGNKGGILIMKGAVIKVESGGKIELNAKGFTRLQPAPGAGGNGGYCGPYNNEWGTAQAAASGGGGGYGTAGATGGRGGQSVGGTGGIVYGSDDTLLNNIYLGSEGGDGGGCRLSARGTQGLSGCAAVADINWGGGAGGSGGGIIMLMGNSLTIAGTVEAKGSDGNSRMLGSVPDQCQSLGAGGGGSGGSILVVANQKTVAAGALQVGGAAGGSGRFSTGGIGGLGRYIIKIPDLCASVTCSSGVCKLETGICVQCISNNNCNAGNKCDISTNTCVVDRCAGKICPTGQKCNPADGTCVACQSAQIVKFVLRDRANLADGVSSGTITLFDQNGVATGTTSFGSLPNDGSPVTVALPAPISASSVKITLDLSAFTQNVGLAEVEIYSGTSTSATKLTGLTCTAGSQYDGSHLCSNALDGDPTTDWATKGNTNPYIMINWC